jgi:phospholipase/carboxylesterase
MPAPVTRRAFCVGAATAAGAALVGGCRLGTTEPPRAGQGGDGRLLARPGRPTAEVAPGIHALGASGDRDGWLLVPAGYDASRAWPLALFFRGAITPAIAYVEAFQPFCDEAGLVLLAPEARAQTWDLVYGAFGPDVAHVDHVLGETFRRVRVDAARVSISGFSDGASYALSLGVTNGDLVRRVVAHAPGFVAPAERRGRPEILVAHGTGDAVLPIAQTSHRIVPQLRELGYTVTLREWDGGHGVYLPLAREGILWMAE